MSGAGDGPRIKVRPMRCKKCGREVETALGPNGRYITGHRTTDPHTPETPWCEGSGAKVRRATR